MKKTFSLSIVFFMATMSAIAQPLLVGHRGSYWGVENTAEAFINGAEKGYHYLECDVKVAGDGTLVLSHDDSTSRLGGSLTIASSTIAQLKAETYSQTRGGITYTAKICTLDEYLKICAEYNVKPVIELKWATGINTNDCSGIPALIKVIEDNGFRNKCVILTSMKPCLEYIRKNYPDITLQFLTGEYWANHFDWCVEQDIDVDIQAGYFDKETVTKFHDAGLKVNMWTANDNAAYRTYGNYGCDFITTDYLDPAALPQLDANVLFPPNTTDYPNASGTIRGYYKPQPVNSIAPTEIPESEKVSRALLRNGKWYILTNNLAEGDGSRIDIHDAESGEKIKEMDMTGITGGSIAVNDISFTADGVLLGCNLATANYTGNADIWKIYKWSSDDASPEVFAELASSMKIGNWDSVTLGGSMAVSGPMKDLYIYATACSPAEEPGIYCIAGMQFANGTAGKSAWAKHSTYTQEAWGQKPSLTVTPSSRDNLLVDSHTMHPIEYTFNWDGINNPMTNYSTMPDGFSEAESTGISYLRYGTKAYAYAASKTDGGVSARMYDVTDSLKNITAVSPFVPDGIDAPDDAYIGTGIELADGKINLYTYIERGGFTKYTVITNESASEPSPNADFALELLWQNSINTDNVPEHIDGTNAQQGGAANGLFYVNDCADKKIYIFNQTGCLGSISGGEGWGCALDDAGNIIVRNDKLTGTSHSFIIYPAGATVDNPGEAITLDVTVALAGQTNFISASGNVLGDGGNIYMYPNSQSAINIISMSNGAVTSSKASKDISLTGTTAGYVIPIDDNSENWIYQVRNTGYYTYNGGDNTILLTGRSSTTAPARNSTVGGEYVTLSGHQIFMHNSGANYTGGFTIRNLTTNKVITSVAPIGTLGYTTGGNYSVANWLYAEKIDDGSCYIYQYCPANGMAVYRLYDKNASGTEELICEKDGITIFPSPATTTLTIKTGTPTNDIGIYSLSGVSLKTDIISRTDNETVLNIEKLASGMYILKCGDHDATKFIKK